MRVAFVRRSECVPKNFRSKTNAGDPLANQSGVLSRRYWPISTATAAEEEFTGLSLGGCDIIVDRLSGLFCHLDLTGWPVIFWRTVAGSSA
jgi:hypothetical protein